MSQLKAHWKNLSLARKTVIILPLLVLLWFIGWRQWRIWSIPDIGKPFDTASFLEPFKDEDLDNAFADYRKAGVIGFSLNLRSQKLWEQFDASILNWESAGWRLEKSITENEQFLINCQKATEKKYGFEVRPDLLKLNTVLQVTQDIRSYARLQILAASRNTALGEWEQAWADYRALLQLSRQLRLVGIISRLVGIAIQAIATEPFAFFLASAELDVEMLRTIQQEIDEIYSRIPPVSVSIKSEYWLRQTEISNALERYGILIPLLNEAELTSRCDKLLMKNWLSQCDLPRMERAALVEDRHESILNRLFGTNLIPGFNYEYFELQDASSGSATISSEQLATHLRKLIMGALVLSETDLVIGALLEADDRDQTRRFALQLQIALHLFHREQGQFPDRLEQLVPAYLNEVPCDPFGKGEAFRYRREGEHAVLYTIGKDGGDDGGPALENYSMPVVDYEAWGDLWKKGDPYFIVYAPGTKAPVHKLKPAKAERE